MSSDIDLEDDQDAPSEDQPESSDEPLLELEGITVNFSPGGVIRRFLADEEILAVDDVSIQLEENDLIALVGESGSGKTTLGKVAIGLQRPTSGTVRYRGQDIWEARDDPGSSDIEWSRIRSALQIIHQDPESSLNSTRTVLSSLMDPLDMSRPDLQPHERENSIYQLLDFVGMSPPQDYANRYPHQLSGGEKQRVALVRALLMNPEVIFADEAISALDVSLRLEMMDVMLELQDVFNTSYLFVSHDLANARYLAEKADGLIGIMYSGRLVEIGTPEQILNDPRHPYTRVLRWSMPPLHPEEAKEGIHDEPPVRKLDIPDPGDLPPGCNFHPRCEQAREVCTREQPDLIEKEGTRAACFRQDDGHEYWNSEPIPEE